MEAQGHFQVREVRATFEELNASQLSMTSAVMESELDFGNDNEELVQGAKIKVFRQLYRPNEENRLREEKQFELWENEETFNRFQKNPIEHTLPVSTITPCLRSFKRVQIRQITHAKTDGTVEHILNLVQRIDPNIEDLEILSNDGRRFSLYLQHREIGLAPINIFGEGVQRILAIALNLLSVQNGVLLIDELDVGIHTSALQTVFRWLVEACRDYNVQLFATTHSLEALDAVLTTVPDDSEEIVSYRLPNPIAGGTLKRFGGNLLHRLRYERGLDVR